MKIREILALTLSVQLVLGAIASFGQTNNQMGAVLKQGRTVSAVSNMGTGPNQPNQGVTNQKADAHGDYLIQTRNQATQGAVSGVVASNNASIEMAGLEWTGQYAERFLRIPEGNSGKPKLVRFLIPVYREKSTEPEASVGTEHKKEQDRRVPEVGSVQ